jgi:phosphate transport system permease protein
LALLRRGGRQPLGVLCLRYICRTTELALAISVGETAPLLYPAGRSSHLWTDAPVRSPIGYQAYAIWAFISEPFAAANALAYVAALPTTAFVLLISLVSRLVALPRRT